MSKQKGNLTQSIHILIALAIMLGLLAVGPFAGLTITGQRVFAFLVFIVYLWITEAVPFAVSGIIIVFGLILIMGNSPVKEANGVVMGTIKAIPIAMSGFSNPGWVLVAAGLFIAEAIRLTGLDRRIALNILHRVGAQPNRIIAGVIVIGYCLAFLIPSMVARAATIIPISFGLIEAFQIDLKSTFARQLMLTTGLVSPISGLMLLTAAAPNPLTASYLASSLGKGIYWGQWFIYAAPMSIGFGILLYFLVTRMNTFEIGDLSKGSLLIEQSLANMGPMSGKEKRIAVIFVITILLWATESLHNIDSNTVAVMAVVLILLPYVGVAVWKDFAGKINLGTLILFGAGISLGEVLLKSGTALWMAKSSLGSFNLSSMAPETVLLCVVIPLIVMRLAFASIAAFAAVVVPTILGLLGSLGNDQLPIWSVTLISSFLVYFSFILPVNTPSAMMAYATNTFDLRDMIKLGIPLTILGIGLFVLLIYTYWHWIGLL